MESQDSSKEKYAEKKAAEACFEAILCLDLAWAESVLLLKYKRKRRPPHPPLAMLLALIYARLNHIPSFNQLYTVLDKDPNLVRELGFRKAPHHDSFSEFALRIGAETITELFQMFVERLKDEIPDLGKGLVAVDTTLFRAYSRPSRPGKRKTDPDAAWGVAGEKAGKPVYVYGFKLGLVSDEREIPLSFNLFGGKKSRGKVVRREIDRKKESIDKQPGLPHDSTLLHQQLLTYLAAGTTPEILTADAGYDSRENNLLCIKYAIDPVIARKATKAGQRTRKWDYLLRIQPYSDEWNYYYSKRSPAVEHVFSRLKQELGLMSLKRRTLPRVTFHVAISLIIMLAIALAAYKNGRYGDFRSVGPWRH